MSDNISVQLREARKMYDSKKYSESLELYEQLFNQNPESFNKGNLISYCWAIYQVHIKNFTNEDELFDATDRITELIPQEDLNHCNTCPYAFSVMEVLKYLNDEKQYYNMSYWIDITNPSLLDENKTNPNSRSRKERFYEYASKSYLACAEWDLCIEVSKEALESVKSFTNYGDVWHKWRIAKALKELNRNEEALDYLMEVVSFKDDWFIFREFAENYYVLGDFENAVKYVCEAILAKGPVKMKVNLYCLAYKLLEESEPDMAYRHAELCYLLKMQSNAQIPDELEDLMIDTDELDKKQLIKQISTYWSEFRFADKALEYGTVTGYFEDKNYGFITDDDDESVFFHKSEVKGDNVYVGQLVSFYRQESFDKSKNKKSVKAVNVRGE